MPSVIVIAIQGAIVRPTRCIAGSVAQLLVIRQKNALRATM
jgi:hypothetical protein